MGTNMSPRFYRSLPSTLFGSVLDAILTPGPSEALESRRVPGERYLAKIDDGRKRTPGVITAIFLCRRSPADGKSSPTREAAFYESIQLPEELMPESTRVGRVIIPGKS
jgi:hypothetical protein